MAAIYASLASEDRISYYTLAHSKHIRLGISARSFTPWDSPNTIRKYELVILERNFYEISGHNFNLFYREVHKYAEDVRKEIRELLHHKVQVGDRFSVTTDEYTSLKIARHCCVNVHLPGGDHIGLGMIRVTGSLTGERAAEILSHKLEQFGIEDNHVLVANTTDGASVMKKMGRILKWIHQLCHAHGR